MFLDKRDLESYLWDDEILDKLVAANPLPIQTTSDGTEQIECSEPIQAVNPLKIEKARLIRAARQDRHLPHPDNF